MPRTFDTIEVLPHEPPLPATRMEELSLRGLHCGCSRRLSRDWMNTDQLHLRARDGSETQFGCLSRVNGFLYYLEFDSTEPYPFEDASFEWAHAEHFIEHLKLEETIAWLTEVRRVLRPGGLLRLSTPDLRRYAEG